jgi:ribosomal-protein-alanine N-acetyltransferase
LFRIKEADIQDFLWLDKTESNFFNSSNSEYERYEKIMKMYPENNYIIFLACYKNNNIGYIAGEKISSELHIYNLLILNEYRNKGYGDRLLDFYIKYNSNIKTIFVELRESNLKALNLYLDKGFVKYNNRKNYYSHPNEDAILMKLTSKI